MLLCWPFTFVLFQKIFNQKFRRFSIKHCDLIYQSAALIGEEKPPPSFLLRKGKAANHVSRTVSIITLQSLHEDQHRCSCFFPCCQNSIYLLPARTERSQQWALLPSNIPQNCKKQMRHGVPRTAPPTLCPRRKFTSEDWAWQVNRAAGGGGETFWMINHSWKFNMKINLKVFNNVCEFKRHLTDGIINYHYRSFYHCRI